MSARRQIRTSSAVALAVALLLTGCAGSGTDAGATVTVSDDATATADSDAPISAPLCAEGATDCDDTIDEVDDGAASGSCLVGDEDCTDESYNGQDVARPLPLSSEPSGAPAIEPGTTDGATGAALTGVHQLDDSTLELTFRSGSCDLLEDVLVNPSETEVRVLVLTGQDPSVDMCTAEAVEYSTTVSLDTPLGDRTVLDLAG